MGKQEGQRGHEASRPKLHAIRHTDEQIFRLKGSVDDASLMDVVEDQCNGRNNNSRLRHAQRALHTIDAGALIGDFP